MAPVRPADVYYLVADIGGTNTRVALADGIHLLPGTVRRYRNADYSGLETVLRGFLKEQGNVDCSGACIAVAGPVRDGLGELTNLDWTIDRETLASASNSETVSILNDLQAQGHALHRIAAKNLRELIPTPPHGPQAVQLVIGIGTGFNASAVYPTGQIRLVTPSEAGHANMPVHTQADLQLCRYVESLLGFAGIEDILSGRGLERIYNWLGQNESDLQLADAAGIVKSLADGSDPRAKDACRIFARMFGTVAGNLALVHLPFGGIYLSGGVARAMAPHLSDLEFARAFRDKGRFSEFMRNFGMHVIEDDFAALAGCASHLDSLTRRA